ncbi:hypothetical protein VP01_3093g5, partial [Puccinia sorghi]
SADHLILDSGTSAHIFKNSCFFKSLEVGKFDVIKNGKKDVTLPIKGKAMVLLLWGEGTLSLENCLDVPDIFINLVSGEKENFECKSCVLSKITKQLFKKQSTLAEKPFQRLNLDLIGPIQPESTHKHQYVLNLIDNSSRYIAGFPLTHKKYNRCPHQSVDSQREILISEPHHPEHNSRAERTKRTIVESIRSTFASSHLPNKLWHEVLKSCCLSLKQIPRKEDYLSPWEIINWRKFPTEMLQPVGTPLVILKMTRHKG